MAKKAARRPQGQVLSRVWIITVQIENTSDVLRMDKMNIEGVFADRDDALQAIEELKSNFAPAEKWKTFAYTPQSKPSASGVDSSAGWLLDDDGAGESVQIRITQARIWPQVATETTLEADVKKAVELDKKGIKGPKGRGKSAAAGK